MQVFVHIGGKNYGPYAVEQLRSYVKAGNFKEDHLACFDSKNWVRINQVPGFLVEAKTQPAAPQKVAKVVPTKTKKQRTKKLVIVSLSVMAVLSVVILSIAWATDYLLEEKIDEAMLQARTFSPSALIKLSRCMTGIPSRSTYPSRCQYLEMNYPSV